MSISADTPLDETLNRSPLALLLRRQYEFPFGINLVQFSFFNFPFHFNAAFFFQTRVFSDLKIISTINLYQSFKNKRIKYSETRL